MKSDYPIYILMIMIGLGILLHSLTQPYQFVKEGDMVYRFNLRNGEVYKHDSKTRYGEISHWEKTHK